MGNRSTEYPDYAVKIFHLVRLSHPEKGVFYIPFSVKNMAERTDRLKDGYPDWDISSLSVNVEDLGDISTGVRRFEMFTNGYTQWIGVQFVDTPAWDTANRRLN